MTRKRRFSSTQALVLTVSALGACSDSKDKSPQTGNAMHFLDDCGASCVLGLECVCGVCTKPCDAVLECTSIVAEADCVATSAAHPECEGSVPARVCDVPCDSSADCAALAAAPRCVSGYCRATAAGVDGSVSGGAGGAGGGAAGGVGAAAGSGGTGGGPDADAGTSGGGSGAGGSDASAGSGGSGGAGSDAGPSNTATASYNDPCSATGEGACLGHAQTRQLVCDGTKWVANGSCVAGTLCDTRLGANAGSCQPVVAECATEVAGATVCQGASRVICGPDLVTVATVEVCTDQICSNGTCTGVCAPPTTRCSGNAVESCSTEGQWAASQSCTGQACVAGACAGVCSPGTTQCSGNGVQTCDASGQWGIAVPCSSQACIGGVCSGECTPSALQCSGNGVQTCDSTGRWGTVTLCANQACVDGLCSGICTPAATQCSGNGVETCSGSGQWGAAVACVNQTCLGGVCTGVCETGTEQCSGNNVQTCDANGQWATGSRCVSTACVAGVCSGVCAPGAARCSGSAVQTCTASGAWGPSVNCASPLECAGGACVATPPACTGKRLFDDFSGNSLDASKWTTNTNIPQGLASVTQTSGHLELTNRAYLNTVDEFDPAAGGIRITGKWTFDAAWQFGDFLEVLTRTDGTTAPGYGEANVGVECHATMESSLVRVIGWGTTLSNETGTTSFPLALGDTLLFEMTDDGSSVTCAFVNITTGQRATASATVNLASATNLVAFHNREFQSTTNRSLGDDFSIESGFVNRPVHHYMFEDTSGNTAYDLPGTTNGTLGAGASRVASIRGRGISLAGTTNGYVALGNNGSALGRADFTIAFWFRVPDTAHRIDLLGNRTVPGDGKFLQIGMTANGSVEFELDEDAAGTNYHTITGGSGHDDGQWHHVAVRRDGTTLAMFIDGALTVSHTRGGGTPTNLSGGATLRLGSSTIAAALNQQTTGAFDDVRIYASALDDCAIATIGRP